MPVNLLSWGKKSLTKSWKVGEISCWGGGRNKLLLEGGRQGVVWGEEERWGKCDAKELNSRQVLRRAI